MILVAATSRLLRKHGWYDERRPEPNLLQWLELVALATICDVVPLVGLNRAYVVQGLKIMARRENLGLAALADTSRLTRRPDPYALGFVLGPRLNAAGRVGQASLALRLLLATERGEASAIALELERLNKQRQTIEMRVVDEAAAQAESSLGKERKGPVILVSGESWHPGVLGLVAARLKERFQLPTFALGYGRGAELARGGRSRASISARRSGRHSMPVSWSRAAATPWLRGLRFRETVSANSAISWNNALRRLLILWRGIGWISTPSSPQAAPLLI
jgi:single-stranded-DNA-specific exonuclease